ncbi:TPA: hypothetical protein ACQ301_003040 [Yersinia enterocolitica]
MAVKLPPETEVIPMDVLYRSETCRKEVYDNTTESHVTTVRGLNPKLVSLSQADSNGRREAKIAMNGGGKCDWKLSGVRVGIQLSKTSALANGKDVTAANYVFDFDDEGYRNAFGKGKPNTVRGDLVFKTEFFPMEYIYHSINEIDLDLFAGDEKYEKWNRYYKVNGTKNIKIEPVLYLSSVVKLKSSGSSLGKVIATYPDGSSEKINGRVPDYNKLLQMK